MRAEIFAPEREMMARPNPSAWPDTELVERVITGDRVAFAELVRRFEGLLRFVACRQFHLSPADAQDLVQDVLLALWSDGGRTLRSYRGASSLGTWLGAVARHRCLNHLRRTAAQPDQPRLEWRPRQKFNNGMDDRIAVREALARLSQRDQALVRLFFFEGRSYSEIAQTLHLPENTLGWRLFRAKARLKKMLSLPAARASRR
jgi:RNA polymerase sigma-70 factor (ECF subfamily)